MIFSQLFQYLIGQFLLFNEDPNSGGGALLGGGDPAADPNPNEPPTDDPPPADSGVSEGLKELYGDLADKIEWPEGLDDQLKVQPSVKPFVTKDGKLNYAEVIKSHVNAQKAIGKKGIIPPTEHSPKEEWDAYFEKVGFVSNPEEYQIGEKPEDLDIPEEFYSSLKDTLHKHRVPLDAAKEIKSFFEEQTKKGLTEAQQKYESQINENIEALKKDFGAAFNEKIAVAKDYLEELAGDEEDLRGAFNDPAVGSNPAVVKLLVKAATKYYGEDKISGTGTSTGTVSPDDAQEQINEIMANPAYWDSAHPQYKDLQNKADRLYRLKNGKR